MNEMISFAEQICREFGCELSTKEVIGEGFTGSILKISDDLCVKITQKNTSPIFPESMKRCANLCVPMKTFISPSGRYVGYVQPYVKSICLQDYIVKGKRFSEKDVAHIILDVLKGLELLHRHNFVHRDFYPGNILISSRDAAYTAVIIDFDETQRETDHTTPCFRFSGYHAPEIVLNDACYDKNAEIFSVGVIMWELLFGDCPFGGYKFFGAIIAKSWDDYEQNKNRYHQNAADALTTMKNHIKNTHVLSDACSDLLLRLLAEDKKNRISASLAIKHTFFSDIISESKEELH